MRTRKRYLILTENEWRMVLMALNKMRSMIFLYQQSQDHLDVDALQFCTIVSPCVIAVQTG